MKAIQIEEIGGIDNLKEVEIDIPTPQAGQVLVKVQAAPVNFIDTIIREGNMPPNMMPPLPYTFGVEATGTVEDANGSEFSKGQKVGFLGSIDAKTYAEYTLVEADKLIPLSENIDLKAASVIPVNYFTAYHMMHNVVKVESGKTAMVYAASGGVGTALIQLCKIAGVRTVALERKESKMDFPKSQGADLVVCTSKEGWKEEVKAFTEGKGVNYIFNPVAGDTLKDDLELLAVLGQVVIFGMLGGVGSVNLLQEGFNHFGKSASIHFSEIYATYFSDFPLVKKALNELYTWLTEGKINPIYSTLPLAEVGKAHEMIQKGEVKGKMILINE